MTQSVTVGVEIINLKSVTLNIQNILIGLINFI